MSHPIGRRRTDETYEQHMNREADLFAMALLMPERMLREQVDLIRRLDLADDAALKELAKKFGVSVTAMSLRLQQLGIVRAP